MDTVRFTLNGRPVEVRGLPGTTTLLRWLRDHAGLMGTKEACAEGDCGACTVAILEERPGAQAAWRAVDSCLLFLPMLQGREVVTVEGLRAPGAPEGEGYHPAQEAIVGTRASQCGFYTPGVVMNLFEACYRDDLSAADGDALDEQVAGNLCRCTGYRPIRDAAQQVAGTRPDDRFAQARRDWVPGPATLDLQAAGQRYLQPGCLAELFAARAAHPGAVLVAGGTDVALEVTQRHRHFPVVIGLEAIEELRAFRRREDGWSLGAGLSHTRLRELLAGEIPALEKMWRFFGARQIRNRGTLGGNLCTASPVGDMAPVLMALGAIAVVVGPAGERAVPVADFFPAYRRTALQADEILLRVEIPRPAPGAFCSAYKVSKRRELDISAVSAGMSVVLDGGGGVASLRLAYGGVAATPMRALKTEAALLGRPWTEAEVEVAAAALEEDFSPISDVRGSERYRRLVARNLLRGFFLESLRPDRDAPAARPVGPVNV
ncbi:MAG: xanthine dehydrogenase small subunit [Pseudomonadota bacterium]